MPPLYFQTLARSWPLILAVIGQQRRNQDEARPGHARWPHTLTPLTPPPAHTHSHTHTAGPSPPNKTSSSAAQWRLSWKPIIFTGTRSNGDGEEEEQGGRGQCRKLDQSRVLSFGVLSAEPDALKVIWHNSWWIKKKKKKKSPEQDFHLQFSI